MTLNMAAAPQGDLPWLEARRGGRRSWIEDDGGSVARSTFSRTSQATSDRGDDFEELKAAALLGIKGKHRDHVVVLPPHAEVKPAGGLWSVQEGRLSRAAASGLAMRLRF